MSKKKKNKPDMLFEGLSKEEIDHMTDVCLSMADVFDDMDGMRTKTKLDGLQMDELTREVRKAFRKKNK
jgi:Zn-finger domain-containing protein